MNCKNYFHDNNLTDIKSFFYYTNNKFKYGWMDQNNRFHEGVNDGKTYCLQSPEELIINKIGICWDMTELYRCWFNLMTQYNYETYYMFYDDSNGCPSHSILVFYKDNYIFWFEPMFNDVNFNYSGIHKYSNILELLKNAKNIFIENGIHKNIIPKNYDNSKIHLYKYEQPKFHINGYEMRNHIDNSQLIKL